jgi:redox-sensitive bicupin YhaK (pirin superfamily)
VQVTIDPAGRILFESDGQQDVMDLAQWFDGEPIPQTLGEFMLWQCSTPIPTESCGILVDETLGRLSTWDGVERLDLAWRRAGFDPQPQCFNVLASLEQAGVTSSSFEPFGRFAPTRTVDGTFRAEDRFMEGSGVRGWTMDLREGQQIVYAATTPAWMTELLLIGPDGCALEELRTGPVMGEVEVRETGAHVLLLLSEFSDAQPWPVSIEVAEGAEAHSLGAQLSDAFWDDDFDWDAIRDLPENLSAEGRILPLDGTVEGRFRGGASESTTAGQHPLQAWALTLAPGQTVTLDLRSEDFDAYLYLAGGSMLSPIQNDDGGGGLNSQIVYTSAGGGSYLVVASAFREGSQGAYALEAREGDFGYVDDGSWDREDWDWDEGDWDGSWPERNLPENLGTEGRTLVLGARVESRLLGEDSPFMTETGDHPLEAWTLMLAAGQTVTIDLRSDDFDAYLYLAGGGLSSPIQNDDGGDGLNSQIVYTSSEGGRYLVVASSYGMGSGVYSLEAREGDFGYVDDREWDEGEWDWNESEVWFGRELPVDLGAEGRTIGLNATVEGRLTGADARFQTSEGNPLEAWTLTLQPGQTVTLDLQSDDFDAYLYLTGGALSSPIEDDDGGDGLNSRIVYTSEMGGTYLVVVSSFGVGSGPYRLVARGGAASR